MRIPLRRCTRSGLGSGLGLGSGYAYLCGAARGARTAARRLPDEHVLGALARPGLNRADDHLGGRCSESVASGRHPIGRGRPCVAGGWASGARVGRMGCCEARTLWPCFAADPTACDAVACDAGPAARARPAAAQSARRRGSDGTAARCACDTSRRGASSPACCSLTALRCDCRPCGRRSGHMVSANIACSLGDGALRSRLIETNSAQTCAHVWDV